MFSCNRLRLRLRPRPCLYNAKTTSSGPSPSTSTGRTANYPVMNDPSHWDTAKRRHNPSTPATATYHWRRPRVSVPSQPQRPNCATGSVPGHWRRTHLISRADSVDIPSAPATPRSDSHRHRHTTEMPAPRSRPSPTSANVPHVQCAINSSRLGNCACNSGSISADNEPTCTPSASKVHRARPWVKPQSCRRQWSGRDRRPFPRQRAQCCCSRGSGASGKVLVGGCEGDVEMCSSR